MITADSKTEITDSIQWTGGRDRPLHRLHGGRHLYGYDVERGAAVDMVGDRSKHVRSCGMPSDVSSTAARSKEEVRLQSDPVCATLEIGADETGKNRLRTFTS